MVIALLLGMPSPCLPTFLYMDVRVFANFSAGFWYAAWIVEN